MRETRWVAVAVVLAVLGALGAGCGSGNGGGGGGSASSDIGHGITVAKSLPPFTPGAKAGEKPKAPAVLAFARDTQALGFEQLLVGGLQAGAKDAGLRFQVANSGGDPQAVVKDMQQFLAAGVGAMMTLPVDPTAQSPLMGQALQQGAYVASGGFAPAITELNAPQYQGGKALASLAATYIKTKLGGKADVVILNQDSVQPVRPRFQAIRDTLKAIPGVKIVADVEPAQTDSDHAFQTMTTILQKTPHVDVVLGADTVVEGALAALQAAHKDSPTQFLAGVDCETQALADIAKGGPYKGCVGSEPAIFGYAIGHYAGDWLAGKSVPQLLCVRPVTVTGPAEAAQYTADEANPAAVYDDPARRARYLGEYGSISYATRSNYVNFAWSPTAC